VLLGALVALCGVVSLTSVVAAIGERFAGGLADGNAAAAAAAFDIVRAAKEEVTARVAAD
jgi:pyruvate ferredoxin oxidoreductase gamma subunit